MRASRLTLLLAVAVAAASDASDPDADRLKWPVIFAAGEGDAETLRSLLAAGANVHERSRDGETALHVSAIKGSLEAVRALEEGVLEDIREGDVGAILGWGFAPWSGGPFSWLDMLGAAYAAERCDALSETYGPRFACPQLLRDMAEDGETFYERFASDKAAA